MTGQGHAPVAATEPARERLSFTTLPWHTALFTIFPIIALFATNATEARWSDVLPSLVVTLAIAGPAFLVIWTLSRSIHNAGVATSLGAVLILVFGHVQPALAVVLPWDAESYVWAVLTVGLVAYMTRLHRMGPSTTRTFNTVAIVVLIVPMFTIIREDVRGSQVEAAAPKAPIEVSEDRVVTPQRDIFYVVLDRYGARQTLEEIYGLDNSIFYDMLESRGFHILDRSLSNYPKTAHSLAATMNLDYLDELTERVGISDSYRPVYDMFPRHLVGEFLKSQGYSYTHIGSWWGPTSRSDWADENLRYSPRSDFGQLYWSITLVGALADQLGFSQPISNREWLRNSVVFQFDALDKAVSNSGPKFVMAHITVPHEPYVFEPDGDWVSSEVASSRTREQNYWNNVQYANNRVTGFLERVFALPDDQRPIVIITADEGPHPPGWVYSNHPTDWINATDREIAEKFRILNAWYLPDRDAAEVVWDSMSSVNTFRVLLNTYFGTDLEILPDRSIAFVDKEHLYNFFEVTDRLLATER